jgi:hypothetical protein
MGDKGNTLDMQYECHELYKLKDELEQIQKNKGHAKAGES